MFSYIVPKVTLSLHTVGAAYQVEWERSCGCNGQRLPIFIKLATHHDNHILAWYCWKKEQRQDHSRKLQELQKQDNIDVAAFRKAIQEKEWAVITAQWTEQKRWVTLETEQWELETLKQLLEDIPEGPVHDALLNTWSNMFMLWNDGSKAALKHYRKVLLILKRNQLQHALNGNIKDESTRQRGHWAHTVRPYNREWWPMAKIPLGMIQKYWFERNLQRIPIETEDELRLWIYGWKWMTYTVTTLLMSCRLGGANGKYRSWIPLDEQPGYCCLWLFKRELRDLINWPAYPTLLEICSWEVELWDEWAMVGLVKAKGKSVWHMEGRGDLSWAHLTKMKEDLGHILLGVDQWSYTAVAARAVNQQLTRADTRILFGRNTNEEWYNKSFRWLVEGMPWVHQNIETWEEHSSLMQRITTHKRPQLVDKLNPKRGTKSMTTRLLLSNAV